MLSDDYDGVPNAARVSYRLALFVFLTALYALVLHYGWSWHITPSSGLAAPRLGNCLGVAMLLRLMVAQPPTRTSATVDQQFYAHVARLLLFGVTMYLVSFIPF